MSKHLKDFLTSIRNRSIDNKSGRVESDLSCLTKRVEQGVEHFLLGNNLVSGSISATEAVVGNESYAPELIAQSIGVEGIEELVRSCNVPEQYVQAAVEQVGIILHRHVGVKNASTSWAAQTAKSDSMDNHKASRDLGTIFPESVTGEFNTRTGISQESFGININSALPDVKMAITVAIMRFHTGLTPRVMPVRGTSDVMVQYIKSHLEIYDLSSADTKTKRLVDLYEDPTMVKNQLQQIVPRKENDGTGTDSVVVADGILRFGMKADLLKLSIDADKFGHTRVNYTDLVADGVKVKSVVFELTDGTDTEQFEIVVPSTISRLTRPSNAKDSADRNADLEYASFFNSETKTTLGATSVLLAAFTSLDEGLAVRFFIKPSINLKRGIAHCLCSIDIKAHNRIDMSQLSDEAKAAAAALSQTLVGYTLDAKFSEENIRKSNIAIRTHRQPFAYDIPTGRNYIYDYAIGQNNPEENAANLTKIIRIGQDDIVLKVIRETLGFVYDQTALFNGKSLDADLNPGRDYIAGDMVRPYVFLGTLDISKIQSVRTSDRSGDIKQFMLTYLTAVIEKLMLQTFYKQQLADGTPVTFKLITNSPMLGNIIGARHIHNHLNNTDMRGTDGSEYKLVLDNGAVLDVVTSTFNYMQDVMILIPWVNESPESILNFGHNWDYGTMIAHYTPGTSGDASHHRLFANAREMPIPTNPIGAVIDIEGMDSVTFLSIPEETTP